MDSSEIVAEFRRELPFYLRCAESTTEKSAFQMARYFRFQGLVPFPESFTRERILSFLSHLASSPPEGRDKARREASSVNDILKGIRRFARWAMARDYIAKDPTKEIHGLPARDRVLLAPEVSAARRFLAVAMEHGESREMTARNFAMACALVDVGMRAGELLAMDLADILDGEEIKDTFTIRGKGGKERLAPISPELKAAVRVYLELRRAGPGQRALWIDTIGERMTYPALRNTVRRICEKAGVRINLHDFRRYSHTQLWMHGIDQIDGMMISGHSNERDYRLYIRGAMQQRAIVEQRKRSPLALTLAAD